MKAIAHRILININKNLLSIPIKSINLLIPFNLKY